MAIAAFKNKNAIICSYNPAILIKIVRDSFLVNTKKQRIFWNLQIKIKPIFFRIFRFLV